VVYGQTELTKDLMDASEERGLEVIYGRRGRALHAIESDAPFVTYRKTRQSTASTRAHRRLRRFHGPAATRFRLALAPSSSASTRSAGSASLPTCRTCHHELIYSLHQRGFALASMRSESRSRYYIDVPLTERIEDWSDERVWTSSPCACRTTRRRISSMATR
jgi:p-hydroxybenzoate 3-monooxygenase